MDYQNILILNLKHLYQILKEIESDLNFKVYDISDSKILKKKLVEFNNPIVFTNKKIDLDCNQFLFQEYPIKITVTQTNTVFHITFWCLVVYKIPYTNATKYK